MAQGSADQHRGEILFTRISNARDELQDLLKKSSRRESRRQARGGGVSGKSSKGVSCFGDGGAFANEMFVVQAIYELVATEEGPFFAYSLPVHSFYTRRDRVASLTTCRLQWRGHTKSLTTRARPSPDLAVWLE